MASEEAALEPAPEPKRWGIGTAVVGYVFSFFTLAIAVGIYDAIRDVDGNRLTLGLLVANFIGLWLGMLATVAYVVWVQPGGTLRSELGVAFKPMDVVVGVVAGLGTQLVLLPLLYLPWMMADKDFAERLDDPAKNLTDAADGAGYIVLGLAVAVGAPIVEELFFRGVLQNALLRRLRPVVAIGLTSLLFGLAHFTWITVPGLTLFGIVAGTLAYRTGRLGPAITTHFFFNLVTVVALA